MRRVKFPKDAKLRKKLGECLFAEGWTVFDVALLLGYSLNRFEIGRLNSFQTMIQDDIHRLRLVNFYLEKYDIRAEM